jgi:EAL domain-containing protein (putative c-di-GMP-specific phosphodiesterase class I)
MVKLELCKGLIKPQKSFTFMFDHNLITRGSKKVNAFDFIPDKENEIRQTQQLRQAILGDQFIIHYQPIMDTKTGRLVSAEALIRWNHPELGIIPPSNFIKQAEENGLIIPIGKWVLRKVCAQLVSWRKAGIPLIPISINISAQQFSQANFIHEVQDLLNYDHLEGSLLIFEISETSLIKNETTIFEALSELRKLGVKIHIDHFGTGYSSLSYLTSFQLDGIKIDRSFIQNISWKSENATITTALINISQNLEINVIAEGVETEEDRQFLQKQNCPQIQGFLLGKPCSVEEFEPVLIKREETSIKKEMTSGGRKTFRIEMKDFIQSEIALIDYPEEKRKKGEIRLLIENIGPGGLRFTSNLEIMVGQEMIYSFKTEAKEEAIQIPGVVIWNDEIKDEEYQYGVQFIFPESQRTYLTKLLNKYSKYLMPVTTRV